MGSLCPISTERAEDSEAGRFGEVLGMRVFSRLDESEGVKVARYSSPRTMNAGSENLIGRSQWRGVDLQTMVTNMRCENSIIGT